MRKFTAQVALVAGPFTRLVSAEELHYCDTRPGHIRNAGLNYYYQLTQLTLIELLLHNQIVPDVAILGLESDSELMFTSFLRLNYHMSRNTAILVRLAAAERVREFVQIQPREFTATEESGWLVANKLQQRRVSLIRQTVRRHGSTILPLG